jgi:nucleotide-binding universal stress UspA family protein
MAAKPRILVPVDFSEASAPALRYAATLCEQLDATLHVVHVHKPDYAIPLETTLTSAGGPSRTLGDLARSDARRRLSALVAEAGLDSVQPTEIRVEVGAPHELIVTLAEQGRYTLIVVGTRSVAGILGSVAERLLSDAPCPVVTVPAPSDHAHAPVA